MVRGNSRPPKWVPRGNPKSRGAQQTISVLQCWAQKAKQDQEQRKNARQTGTGVMSSEVVVLDDDPMDQPCVSTANTDPVSAMPTVRRQIPESSITKNAKRKMNFSLTSEAQLKERGADLNALNMIHFSIGEITRPWEREVVRAASKHNLAVSIPFDTSGAHVAATLLYNFTRWFPECHCACTILKKDHGEAILERCRTIGIAPSEITEVDNAAAFKKLKPNEIGRILLCSPQVLTKICETFPAFASSLCCILFNFESPSETVTKYKKIVEIVMTAVPSRLCRLIVIAPRHIKAQTKGSAIATRQIMITNLGLSDWMQFGPSDHEFRIHHISTRVGIEYWDKNEIDITDENSWMSRWKEAGRDLLKSLAKDLKNLPSLEPDDFFYVDWELAFKDLSSCSTSTMLLASSLKFVLESYRNLVLNGPRAFYLYCYKLLQAPTSEALNLQTFLATNSELYDVYQEIQETYAYSADNDYDIGFKEKSMNSHPKWIHLRKNVDALLNTGRAMKVVILCESACSARVAAETLNGLTSNSKTVITVVNAVFNENIIKEVAFRSLHKTLQGIPNFLQTPGTNFAIIRMDLPLVVNVLDQIAGAFPDLIFSMDRRSLGWLPLNTTEHCAILSQRFEKLRPTDGHAPDEFNVNDSALRYEAVSIFDKFDFDYHASSLCLDVDKMQIREYCHTNNADNEDYRLLASDRKTYENLAFGTFPKPIQAPPKIGVLDEDQLYWNTLDHSLYGKVPSGKLSSHFLKHLSTKKFQLVPNEFEFVEEPGVAERRKKIDELIAQLDAVFPLHLANKDSL